jgi:tetratricopeptide (TPR) repeat protein
MPAIFISHSSLDQKAADDIKAVLAGLGFDRVFLDFDKVTGIGAGENWEKRLYEELARCHAVILILTPNWLASKWCFAELQQARALGKVILPIVFSPLGESYVLPDIQAIDLIDWKQEGLTRLERRLHAITHELARGFRLEPGRPPYPGIHAFEAEDAAIYFGRDDETRAVIEKLDARRTQGGARFLLVIGASGAGKSSLLKAGVLPQLARRRSHWLLLPVMRPEKAPLEAFTKALAQHLGRENDWRALYDDLSGPDAAGRIERIVQDLRVGDRRAATILIPIDQFEELFTIADASERALLLTLLAAILDPARDLPLMMIATGRADVLQGLLETSALAPLMDTTSLLPMPLERVPLLVEGPAAVASLIVEKGLPERIMRDVENPEALPLLAYTLHLLNERSLDKRLTHDAYHALGADDLNPVQNAVRLGADEAIARLKPTEQEMAALRDAFVPHLVRLRLDDKRHVRQPAPLAALPQDAERLIHSLIDARLLASRSGQDGKATVEVAHEALFSAWPTLKGWLAEEQDFLADIERLKGAHETWLEAPDAQKPEALLHGLLLSRARAWILKHPSRFTGGGMDRLRGFVADSAAADDAEQTMARAQAQRSRKLSRWLFRAATVGTMIFALIAAFAGWQYLQADRAKKAAEQSLGLLKRAVTSATLINVGETRRVAGDLSGALAAYREGLVTRRDLVVAMPNDLDWQRDVGITLDRIGDVLRDLGRMQESLKSYAENVTILSKISNREPNNEQWQRDTSAALNKLGDVRVAIGDLMGAQSAYDESQAILQRSVARDPGNSKLQRDLATNLARSGDVRRAFRDFPGALAGYENSLAVARRLAASDPGNAQWQRDVSVGLGNIGDVKLETGRRDGARAAYEESLAIRRKLADGDPGNAQWQRDVSNILSRVGDVMLADGDPSGALTAYEEGLTIRRKLAAADPGNARWQRDVGISLSKVGDVRLTAADRAGALLAYEEGLAFQRKLAAADPGNAGWQRDVSVGLNKVGDVRLADGDRAGARAAYEEGLAIVRKLAAADPGNAGWQRDVSVGLNKVGDLRLADGDRAGARAAYEESLTIYRKLAAADPGNTEWQIDLFLGLYEVGTASDPAPARKFLTEALSIVERLAREDKLLGNQKGWPQTIRSELAKLPPDPVNSR